MIERGYTSGPLWRSYAHRFLDSTSKETTERRSYTPGIAQTESPVVPETPGEHLPASRESQAVASVGME